MSVVKITFKTPKDFEVDISDISNISPRGLELAFAAVEKAFAGKKGEVLFAAKRAEEAAAQRAAKERAEAERVAQLEAEELAKNRQAAEVAARARFESESRENQAQLLKAFEEKQSNAQLEKFLAAVADVVSGAEESPKENGADTADAVETAANEPA